ncbi:MAG TPA: hypothetical protein VLB80_04835 [Candidatus Babeliales bacterium]|nr:hypothetical protein [Candidatus Babeliales bacterium]
MKKIFIGIITMIIMITTATHIICFDDKIDTIHVKLSLKKMSSENVDEKINNLSHKNDEHACDVLRIAWEDKHNTYSVISAYISIKNSNLFLLRMRNPFCWTKNYLDGVPLTLESKESHMFRFPSSLPDDFVETLKKEGTITLKDALFEKPVKIVLELDSIDGSNYINPLFKRRKKIKKIKEKRVDILNDFSEFSKTERMKIRSYSMCDSIHE